MQYFNRKSKGWKSQASHHPYNDHRAFLLLEVIQPRNSLKFVSSDVFSGSDLFVTIIALRQEFSGFCKKARIEKRKDYDFRAENLMRKSVLFIRDRPGKRFERVLFHTCVRMRKLRS